MSLSQDNNILSEEAILQGIHECVHGSVVRHILKLPVETLIKYLSKFPFYLGADTLYYLLLRKVGSDAYYSDDGRHLVTINPELLGVYVLAEQNLKAPVTREVTDSEETIYHLIKSNIDRTITCYRYQLRNSIIIGEASFESAWSNPSIALNIPLYQGMFHKMAFLQEILISLIDNDCWEPIDVLNQNIFSLILQRMAFVKGAYPNLWDLLMKEYYQQQLLRLKIYDYLSVVATRQITVLNAFFPDIIRLPPKLDTIGIRLWFAPRSVRGYLLGYDVCNGVPSDEIISERLYHLQDIGIERYTDEITGIYMENNKILTGKIGMMFYPHLKGKKLINVKDLSGSSLGIYYPQDLYPISDGNNVVILTRSDIDSIIPVNTLSPQSLTSLLTKDNIPYLVESPDQETIKSIFDRLTCDIPIRCGIPVRTKLVETMSYDILNF